MLMSLAGGPVGVCGKPTGHTAWEAVAQNLPSLSDVSPSSTVSAVPPGGPGGAVVN